MLAGSAVKSKMVCRRLLPRGRAAFRLFCCSSDAVVEVPMCAPAEAEVGSGRA